MSNRFYVGDKVIVDHTRCTHRPALIHAVVKACDLVAGDYLVAGEYKNADGKLVAGQAYFTADELTLKKEN